MKKIPITINGKQYESIAEACKGEKISYHAVTTRRKKGKSIEEQFAKVKENKKVVTVDKTTYPSLTAAAKAHKINPAHLRQLMRRNPGMSAETAIHKFINGEVNKIRSIKVVVDGKEYDSIKDAAQAANVTGQTLRDYQKKHNCSKEEAIRYYLNNEKAKHKSIVIDGVRYENAKAACEKLKINYTYLCKRKSRRHSSFEAEIYYFLNKKKQRSTATSQVIIQEDAPLACVNNKKTNVSHTKLER